MGCLPGVIRTRVGYTGGTKADPTYYALGDHAETVQVDYDPAAVTYEDLVEAFFAAHDATRAGPSRQYMSAIFFGDAEQEGIARTVTARIEAETGKEVRTEILPLERFYLAEDYHQKYYLQGDSKLLAELRAMYPDFWEFVDSPAASRINAYLYGCASPEQVRADLDRLGLSEEGRARLEARAGD